MTRSDTLWYKKTFMIKMPISTGFEIMRYRCENNPILWHRPSVVLSWQQCTKATPSLFRELSIGNLCKKVFLGTGIKTPNSIYFDKKMYFTIFSLLIIVFLITKFCKIEKWSLIPLWNNLNMAQPQSWSRTIYPPIT